MAHLAGIYTSLSARPWALAKPTILLKIHSTTWGRAGGMHGIRNWDLAFFLY
jgi:hypothetical protein